MGIHLEGKRRGSFEGNRVLPKGERGRGLWGEECVGVQYVDHGGKRLKKSPEKKYRVRRIRTWV